MSFPNLDEETKGKLGRGYDVCWFPDCEAVWRTEQGTYCPVCDTYRCPECGRCFCDLPPFTQHVLDAEMASIGAWEPWHNPPRRKRRTKRKYVVRFLRDHGGFKRGDEGTLASNVAFELKERGVVEILKEYVRE